MLSHYMVIYCLQKATDVERALGSPPDSFGSFTSPSISIEMEIQ